MWLGFAVCAFSFICTIVLVYMDWRQDILTQMKEIIETNTAIIQKEENKNIPISSLPRIFYMMVTLCMLMYGGILPFNYIATKFLIKTW
jgi:hypothetical protein